MNPLQWKREHQIALTLALVLGAILGFMLARQFVDPYGHTVEYTKMNGALGWFDIYWVIVIA